jgi:hypothetical protein
MAFLAAFFLLPEERFDGKGIAGSCLDWPFVRSIWNGLDWVGIGNRHQHSNVRNPAFTAENLPFRIVV